MIEIYLFILKIEATVYRLRMMHRKIINHAAPSPRNFFKYYRETKKLRKNLLTRAWLIEESLLSV